MNKNIKAQVEQRLEAEAKARAAKLKPSEIKKLEISNDELVGYLNENRVVDAKLWPFRL